MILVLEPRHRVVGLRFKRGTGQTAGMGRLKHRQTAAMQQVVNQRSDEHGLASPRKAGDAEPQRGLDQIAGPVGEGVKGDQRLIGEGGDGRRHGCLSQLNCFRRYRRVKGRLKAQA